MFIIFLEFFRNSWPVVAPLCPQNVYHIPVDMPTLYWSRGAKLGGHFREPHSYAAERSFSQVTKS